jgi:hypothetical protein
MSKQEKKTNTAVSQKNHTALQMMKKPFPHPYFANLIACFSAFPSFGNAAMESEDPGRGPGSCAVDGDDASF